MKKTMLFVSAVLVALAFAACGGQGSGNNENGEDSTAVAAAQDTTAQTAEAEATAEETVEAEAEVPTLNTNLLGKYSNHNDPLIVLEVSDKYGNHGEHKGYGYVAASNEYFETDFIFVFTSITPDGDNIKVHYDEMESYNTGDPDDLGGEDYGEWVEEKVGEGDLTLIPAGAGKVKIDCKEKRIKNVVLSK